MRKPVTVTVQTSVLARAAPACEICLEPASLARYTAIGRRIGQFAHIRAVSPGGPRYDPSFPQDQIDEPENLFWCCTDCHGIVDNVNAWTLEHLLATLEKNRGSGRALSTFTVDGEINVTAAFSETVTGIDTGGKSTTLMPGTRVNVTAIGSGTVIGVKT